METVSSIFLAVWLTLSGIFGIQAEPELGTLSVLKASQGGSGIGTAAPSDVGKVLKVSDDSPFTYTLQDDNTGAGGSFPFTPTSYGNSTSSVLGLLGGVFSNASSTFHILKAGSASTTNLTVSSLNSANCDVKASSDGTFSCGTDATGAGGGTASVSTSSSETSGRVPFWTTTSGTPAQLSGGVAGFAWNDTFKRLTATYASSTTFSATTIYGALIGNADTATALAADPANCSAGNAPLGIVASGAVEGCFDVWTEAENTSAGYVVGTRALTVAGTANQITSSAGSQNLTADRTWTLSLPSHVIFPSSFQVGSATTTHATSTNQAITGLLTFNGVTASTWAAFCTTITSGAGLCDGNDATGSGGNTDSVLWANASTSPWVASSLTALSSSSIAFLDTVNGTTTNATSTFKYVSSHLRAASFRNDAVTSAIVSATASGVQQGTTVSSPLSFSGVTLSCATCATFAYPFTTFTSWFSTSTLMLNTGGFMSTASSTFHILNNTYASSTYASISGTASTSALIVSGLNAASCDLKASSTGVISCGTDAVGAGGSTDAVLWANASSSPWSVLSLNANSSSSIAFLSMTRATSTDFFSTNATSTQGYFATHLYSAGTTRINVNSGLLSTGATGVIQSTTISSPLGFSANTLTCTTCATFSYPYTPFTSWFSTSTIYLNTAGIMSTASSSIAFLDTVNGTTTNATSTFNYVSSHLRVAGTARFDSYVGIGRGPNSPILLTVGTTTGASNPTLDNTVVNFVGGDGGPFRMQLDTFNNNTTFGSQITARRSRGTGAAPSAVLANDTIFTLAGSGYGASQYGNSVAQLSIGAAQTWTNTSNPTFWRFFTTPINSVTSVESVRINEDGQVGIGTTSPRWGLTVASSTGPQVAFADGSLTSNIWTMRNMRGTLYFASSSPTTFATSSTAALEIRDSTGPGLGIGTSTPWRTLSVAGTFGLSSTLTTATGGTNQTLCINSSSYEVVRETTTVCAVSSRKFKHDIETLDLSGIDTVSQLSPVRYTYNDDVASDYKNVKLGFIAEEVAAVDPHLAEYGEDGKPRNLDDRAIIAVVVQALKELIGLNNTQDARLDALEHRVLELEKENALLKAH